MTTSSKKSASDAFYSAGNTAQTFDSAIKAGKEGADLLLKEGADVAAKGFQTFVSVTKEAAEGTSKRYDEFAAIGKKNVEAGIAAADAWATNCETFNAKVIELSQQAMAEGFNAATLILSAKNPQEAAKLQADFVSAGVSRMIEQATKMSELSIKAANEAYAPLNAQIAQFMERFTKQVA
ncbi:MAG: phasin family protein [Alphaproteobacteria bacterium]|nr:phasin family protein [Alphaproteobacteria bacterium]